MKGNGGEKFRVKGITRSPSKLIDFGPFVY